LGILTDEDLAIEHSSRGIRYDSLEKLIAVAVGFRVVNESVIVDV
jgi:hypothetical protein